MAQTHYLIAGASHAALSALHAIRLADAEHDVTVLTRERHLPYSPTVLPYVVSGRSVPERVFLRDESYFTSLNATLRLGAAIEKVDAGESAVTLSGGERIGYAKLLLATGAAPALPTVQGLAQTHFHVLRTLDDALALRQALGATRRAVVLGGGLIGMHAAENLAKAGAEVTVVEIQPHVLSGYFDASASTLIEAVFAGHDVRILAGQQVRAVSPAGDGARITLGNGGELEADLLLVATGVSPAMDFLDGSGIETDRGVLVDDWMHTSAENVWAAGDVAQARGYFDAEKVLNGILPDAVGQGRIAGMAMAGDPAAKPYRGGVPLNTYAFFGQQAVSVGVQEPRTAEPDVEVHAESDPGRVYYRKIVLKGNRLLGIFGINAAFDPGVMWELVLRGIDLGPVRREFLEAPQQTARVLMSRTWR